MIKFGEKNFSCDDYSNEEKSVSKVIKDIISRS